ncbi:MFS transporter [Phaeobacter sp.]|uniref:MFS transporter n=1 Tax=Phaeobacter sp. TaxID=1902409 RepID=UPI0025DE374A|nr:MFS transporter [Phaeobacter sp.]
MKLGLVVLCLGYVLSQFYRAFLAILAAPLRLEIGVSPDDLAFASGLWFLVFAVMQFPVGWSLDRIGPRLTASVLLLLGGGGGALVFAMASNPVHIHIAMMLIGVGCSPVLMASYYLFARQYPPQQFATLAAVMLGVGSFGNLIASYPTTLMVDLVGWRGTLVALAGLSAVVALGLFLFVRDPEQPPHDPDRPQGSVLDILRMRALWPIFAIMFVAYAPAAALRGLWIGPYLGDVMNLGASAIGVSSLIMGVAMIAGTFVYGPLDRILGTRKWVIFVGNLCAAVALLLLILWIDGPIWLVVALLAAVGFFGATFPIILAHGRAFVPPHLVGRGVTLLNFFGIGGVGIMQFLTGKVHSEMTGSDPLLPYAALFAVLLAFLVLGLVTYLRSKDRLA